MSIVFKYTYIACNTDISDRASFIKVNGSIFRNNLNLRYINKIWN